MVCQLKSLKLHNPKIITQGWSNCGGAPDCQGCLFMPWNLPFGECYLPRHATTRDYTVCQLKSLKLYNPKIITQGSSNCGGAPDCQGCLFMPRNRPFLLHLTFTYCFIFQSPEHLPAFLSIVGLYDGKNDYSIPINNLLIMYYSPTVTHDKTFVYNFSVL